MKSRKFDHCLACYDELSGRRDKKFCDAHCRSNFQYQQIRNDKSSMHFKVSQQLRLNRKILKEHNKAGKATVRETQFKALGFNPRIFTHYWKARKDKTYLFVYDFGYMRIKDNGKWKYSIVKWQDYMNKQIGF